ncbi:hypothetical protein LJ656_02060 [Paraburkholderia sp. MMS20-SJTR3]|uniref:Uncharacterized protein n=1 Tax=Paraburkholderia sejongensis TaxID=2886946 RepID=A0ABS8JNK4_9BURK|nr:hypothetical protein [Paraburkholderia sp. MMS20-SJTR3]MCC8391359.1 hypothetical protein [Paraburkholderia sp. MMS20-SJTR3]
MKTAPQSTDGDEHANSHANPQADQQADPQADPHAQKNPRSLQETAMPLPHESDQNPQSQHEDDPREVGKQAHEDLEQGLEDTDRRGGGDYQQRTQNDAHTDVNSDRKQSGTKSG